MTVDDGRDAARQALRRRVLWVLPVALLGGFVVSILVQRFVAHRVVPWPVVAIGLAGTLVLVAVELAVILLVRRRRTGSAWGNPAVLLGEPRAVRRRVAKAVRRGQLPDTEPDRHLAVDLAQRQLKQRWLPWLFLGLGTLLVVNVVLGQNTPSRVIAAASVGVDLAVSAYLFVLVRGARRTLSQVQ